jgi:hypothetical protein
MMTPPLRPVVPGIYFDAQDRVVWDYAAFVQHFGGSTGGGGGGGSTELPSGLVSHWDAAVEVTENGTPLVTQWGDPISGNDLTPLNADDSNRPKLIAAGLNDLPYLSCVQAQGAGEFANLFDLSLSPTVDSTTYTCFCVARKQQTGTSGIMVSVSNRHSVGWKNSNWALRSTNFNDPSDDSGVAVDNDWHVFVWQRTGGTTTLYLDGTSIHSASLNAAGEASDRFSMGIGVGGGTTYRFDFAEVGFYNTAEDVATITSALQTKYGLA